MNNESTETLVGTVSFLSKASPTTVSPCSLGRLPLQTPSWLGLQFFSLCTFYQMTVVSCWVSKFLFIWRSVLKLSSLVVILTFCITASISLFFPFPCHELHDHQQEVNFESFLSLELLELFANTRSMTLEISFPPEREKAPLVNQSSWAYILTKELRAALV